MNKKDIFIKEKLQQDKEISDRANQIFENLKEEFIMDNNKDKKVITISFKKFLALAASFVLVLFLGTNLYAHTLGKPNIFTAIKNLFNVDTEDYSAAEEDINITVESNGVKLTLKTAAMDDNVLIVKYVAEGEKLAEEFYTYQDFEKTQIDVNSIWAKLAGDNIEGYEGYTLKDVTIMQKDIVEKLEKQGLTDEEAKELADLGAEAYKEYIGSQLSETEYSEEKAKEKIEQVVAMFESKVTSKYEIITSEDKMSGYNIEKVSQTIEKEENKYVIHTIYNVDTLVDILDKFNFNLQINKIGAIEGNWNYSVELNKAKLNKRVETIDFYNNYEVILDSEIGLKVTLKQLSISDFSSVLNIKTVKDDYYNNNIDYTNLENNIFPITFVVLNENGEVIGTSCQTRENAIKTSAIVDRIILKNVDYNTEKITIKMYSNNDNQLVKTIEVNLQDARHFLDTNLGKSFYNEELGLYFDYPSDWVQTPVQDINVVSLKSPENLDGYCAHLEIGLTDPNTFSMGFDETIEYMKNSFGSTIVENGKLLFGDASYEGDYFIESREDYKGICIFVEVDGQEYKIFFGGNEKIYAKYETLFRETLKTVIFSEATLWKEIEEQNKPSNEIEEDTNVLYGDVNCDGSVNDIDSVYLSKYLAKWSGYELSEDAKVNADINRDGKVNGLDKTILTRYLNNWEGYESLPYVMPTDIEESYLASSMSWTKYTIEKIAFEYPSVLDLKVHYEDGNPEQGTVAVEISGIGTGFNSDTKETMNATLSIDIYELLSKKNVNFDELKLKNNYTTDDGLIWYEDYVPYEDGGWSLTYTCYKGTSEDGYAEYKMSFVSDVDDINFDNIITYLLDSVEFIVY